MTQNKLKIFIMKKLEKLNSKKFKKETMRRIIGGASPGDTYRNEATQTQCGCYTVDRVRYDWVAPMV